MRQIDCERSEDSVLQLETEGVVDAVLVHEMVQLGFRAPVPSPSMLLQPLDLPALALYSLYPLQLGLCAPALAPQCARDLPSTLNPRCVCGMCSLLCLCNLLQSASVCMFVYGDGMG